MRPLASPDELVGGGSPLRVTPPPDASRGRVSTQPHIYGRPAPGQWGAGHSAEPPTSSRDDCCGVPAEVERKAMAALPGEMVAVVERLGGVRDWILRQWMIGSPESI
jgi:hypothetical protein